MALEQVGDFLKDGGASINYAAIGQKIGSGSAVMFQVVIWTSLAMLIGLFFWKFFIQYKHRCLIKIYRAGKLIEIKNDMVKEFIDDQGKRKLKLFWLKASMPKPDHERIFKRGKKDFYELYMDDNGELHAYEDEIIFTGDIEKRFKEKKRSIKDILKGKKAQEEEIDVEKVKAKTKLIPQERVAWLLSENKLLEDKIKQKDKFKEYLQMFIPLAVHALLFLTAFFAYKFLSQSMGALASQMGQIATSCMGR